MSHKKFLGDKPKIDTASNRELQFISNSDSIFSSKPNDSPKLIVIKDMDKGICQNKKLTKHHYHLKIDKIYDEKTLKLCGQCKLQSHLSNDLVQLRRFLKQRTQSNDKFILNKKYFINQVNNDNNQHPQKISDEKIYFKSLDLTTERESGLNHPIYLIPNELFHYKQLTRLHLDRNALKFIPELFGDSLLNLEILTLSNNKLTHLPATFAKLKKLCSLHFASNRFEKFPEVLCELKSLKFLDFTDNKLTEITPKISHLRQIETLLLYKNFLKDLPESMEKMSNLSTLWIGDNNLKKFPTQLLNLKKLDWEEYLLPSHLEGNPFEEPDINVCQQGLQAIRDYYKSKISK